MKHRTVKLCIAIGILAITFNAKADELFSEEITKGIVKALDSRACASGCETTITESGKEEKMSIRLVNINSDKKGEYLVKYNQSDMWCGSGGCPGAVFMRNGNRWVKLAEGFELNVLNSKTKGFFDLSFGEGGKLSWNGQKYD